MLERDIEFRGYTINEDESKWIYGTGVHIRSYTKEYAKKTGLKYRYLIFQEGERWLEVDPLSVSQYTGICDINNQKIYEKDIVLLGANHSVVEFHKGRFITVVESHNDDSPQEIPFEFEPNGKGQTKSEVVGNTYNAKLLEA